MPVIATAGTLNNNAANLNRSIPGNSGYNISRSLRFRSSATTNFNRTPGVAGNTQKWTWSGWVKRGALLATSNIFIASTGASNFISRFFFNSADNTLTISHFQSIGNVWILTTTQAFNDPAAWYHIIVAFDTTQASAANRVKLYVNGVQVTSFSTETYPTSGYSATYINNTNEHRIGSTVGGASSGFDGYMAELNFIDGQQLTPSSFGAYDNNGNWQPIKYSGTYGTNGFYLNFNNTSNIGADSSGNGNNWTPNNINVATANTTYDSMLDVPSNFNDGTAYGRGNYCVLNYLKRTDPATTPGTAEISSGNLNIVNSSANPEYAVGTIGVTSGKWYFEATMTGSPSPGLQWVGINTSDYGSGASIKAYRNDNGQYYNGSAWAAYGASYVSGDVIGVAFDMTGQTIEFFKNNVSQGQKTSIGLTGQTIFPATVITQSSGGFYFNFGQRPFASTPPAGFRALNTNNLPNPPIPNPEAHFKTTLWTGTGANQAISNRNANTQVAFSPGLVWNKSRGAGLSNILTDIIRGNPTPFRSQIFSDQTTAAETRTDRLQSFDTEGFTVGTYQDVNLSGNTFVGWQWNSGRTTNNALNTVGTSSSNTIVNAAAGFSMVVYAGTGSNATVGHGLPKAPNLIITRAINDSGRAWPVYHSGTGANVSYLNTTANNIVDSTIWTAAPNNSVFFIGTGVDINRNVNIHIAYCWTAIPGYSAFGSYTGNGSTDGPFIYTDFRPGFVIIKNATSTNNWSIIDSVRDQFNGASRRQHPNLFTPDNTGAGVVIDLLSNGFKCKNTDPLENQSGQTIIYAAFAEMPFKYARAR
jgi:hypothetical protein